jgi:hypothetical protein
MAITGIQVAKLEARAAGLPASGAPYDWRIWNTLSTYSTVTVRLSRPTHALAEIVLAKFETAREAASYEASLPVLLPGYSGSGVFAYISGATAWTEAEGGNEVPYVLEPGFTDWPSMQRDKLHNTTSVFEHPSLLSISFSLQLLPTVGPEEYFYPYENMYAYAVGKVFEFS